MRNDDPNLYLWRMTATSNSLQMLATLCGVFISVMASNACSGQSVAEEWSTLVQERAEGIDFRAFTANNPDWMVKAAKPELKSAVPALDALETSLLPWGENEAMVDQCMQVMFSDNHRCAQILGVLHGRYGKFIVQELESAALSNSFQWIAAISSAFDTGFDKNGAAGLWGMSPGMAQSYGLLSKAGIDQRKLAEESTKAFVLELKRLQRRFPNDEHRVLVAYWKGMAYATRWTGKPGYDRTLDEQLTLVKVLSRFMVNIERPSFELDWIEQAQTWQPLECEGEGIDRDALISSGNFDDRMLSELLPWWNTGFLTCIDAEKFGARIPKLAINEFPMSRSETSGLEASPKEELINVVRSSESESELIENVSDGIRCILHTVKKGDTLWNIAQRYPGVTPEELAEINGISDYIRIGQTLCVPDPR